MRANHVPRSPSSSEIESGMNTKSVSLLNEFCCRKPHRFARGARPSLIRPLHTVQEPVSRLFQAHHKKLAKAANSSDPEQILMARCMLRVCLDHMGSAR